MTSPFEPPYPIADLRALLSERVKLDLSPIELAEILWLALQNGEVVAERQGERSHASPSEETRPAQPSSLDQGMENQANPSTASVVTKPPQRNEEGEGDAEHPPPPGMAVPVKIPEAIALRNRREIARSLRPLMRKVPSKLRQSIDEELTVIQIAEAQTWSPVVKPDPERWLELAIVVEVTSLLDVWRDTVSEFRQLMERHGAFRDVRTWELKSNEQGKLQLFLQTASGLKGNARNPRELLDAGGRRLVLLLSDCTSRAWRSGKMPQLLKLWSRENPVTIVQLLPERYWDRSALGLGYPVALRSRLPGALSRDWAIEGLSPRRRQRLPGGLKIPVVTMQPESLGRWAKALSAIAEQTTTGILLGTQALQPTDVKGATTESLTAKQLVQRFRGTASDEAQELADMMAVLPVNWSVIRLIQKNLAHGADPVSETGALYLAEIFLSGLLCPVVLTTEQPQKCQISPQYDFVEGVRNVLLGTIPISEAQEIGEKVATEIFRQLPMEVQERVSADIERRFGESLSYFEAFLIPDLPWGEDATAEILPFARVTGQVLRRWGREYAALAEELERSQVEDEPQTEEYHLDEAAAHIVLEQQLNYFQQEILDAFVQQEHQFELSFPGLHPKEIAAQPSPEEIVLLETTEDSVTILDRKLTQSSEDHLSFELEVRISFTVEISYFDFDEYHPEFNESPTFEQTVSNQTVNAVAEVALWFLGESRSEADPELIGLRVEQPILINPREAAEPSIPVPPLQGFEFEVATIAFDDDSFTGESGAAHAAAIAWFTEQRIEVRSYSSAEDRMTRVFDRFALEVGEHYDVLAPLLLQMKRAVFRENIAFHYALGDIPQNMISRCVGFGHNLLNEGLLSQFNYDRANRAISGALATQPYVTEFFSGSWFKRYICQKILALLQAQELSYGYLISPVVELLNGDRLELDLFFLVENKPILVECVTERDIENAIHEVSRYSQGLGIPSSQVFLIALELTPEQVETFRLRRSLVIASRETYLPHIQAILETSPDDSSVIVLESFEYEVATLTLPAQQLIRELSAVPLNAFQRVDEAVYDSTGDRLSPLQQEIFTKTWEDLTYDEIAIALRNNSRYIRKQASELWTLLSQVLGQEVMKTTLQEAVLQWATAGVQAVSVSRQQQEGQQFVQDLGNGVDLKMVVIPAGRFVMGSPKDELDRDSDETQHPVTLSTFFLGKYPVTQAQWSAITALPQINRSLNSDPSRFKGSDRPVECVSWWEAVEFCDRLSQLTGRPYRLPSESEWEYACRAGTTTPFHFGETITTDLANYNGNYTYGDGVEGEYRRETNPVGSYGVANAFGLYDMHGNVWEWCGDYWHSDYEGAPEDGSAWVSEDKDANRLRGGSWYLGPRNCRSAVRNFDAPVDRYYNFGFRVVCSA